MERADLERMKELVQKIEDTDSCTVCTLTVEEMLELGRLQRKRVGELEFGFPICSED